MQAGTRRRGRDGGFVIPDGVGSWGWSQTAAAGCRACGAGLRVVPTPAVAECGSPQASQPAPSPLPQCRGPTPPPPPRVCRLLHGRRGHLTVSKIRSSCVALLQNPVVHYYHEKANVILSIIMNLFSSSYP